MSNKAHKTALPKRRFPEFRDAEAWEEKKLGELFLERQERGSLDLPLLSLTDKEGIIPQEDSNRRNTSNSDKSKYLRVHLGDIAYNTMRMWEGRSALVTLEGVISPAYTVCKPKTGVDSLFFFHYFKTKPLIHQFHKYSQGLVKDTLNLKFQAFSKIKVLVPVKLEEQQKIAAALSSLDALLTAQTAKLTALQAHKRGLLQDLFPAEGETVPKRRFPEFRDAGEWEETTLGNIILRVITGPFGSMLHQTDYVAEGIPVLNSQNIVDGKIISISKTLIQEETFKRLKKYALRVGDIVIARRGEMGRCAVVEEDNENWLCGTGSFIIRINPEKSNSNFVNLIVSSEASKQRLENSSIGATMNNLNQYILTDLPVTVPSTAEQQRMADCLSSLNNLITAQSQKLEALKLHKKGLMQALFPAASEQVT